MTENSFMEKVKDSHFEESTIGLEELKTMLKDVMPMEGYVDSEIFAGNGRLTFSVTLYP